MSMWMRYCCKKIHHRTYMCGNFSKQRLFEGHFLLSLQPLIQIKISRSVWRDLVMQFPKSFLQMSSDILIKSCTRSGDGIPNKYIQNGIIYYENIQAQDLIETGIKSKIIKLSSI